MKKKIFYDKRARREFAKLSLHIRKILEGRIEYLEEKGLLQLPEAKKIERDLFEIRVRSEEGAFRCFYAYIKRDFIVILHVFQKKTEKTPQKAIKTAKGRLKLYV